MSNIFFVTATYSVLFLVLFTLGEFLYHVVKAKGELTRKFVHIFGGLISLSFPLFLENHWQVLFLTVSFVTILTLSLLLDLLPSINDVKRITHGSIIFPLVIYLCYFCSHLSGEDMYFYLPIVVLAIGDPIANILGKSFPVLPYTNFGFTKTVSGSLGFFVTAFICSYLILEHLQYWTLVQNCKLAVMIAVVTTVIESFSHKGYDNLTIPVSTILVIMVFNNFIFA